MALDLEERVGWPQELRFLLERYPREVWPAHANLGDLARFWLARHDLFRELSGSMLQSTAELCQGRIEAQPYARWLAPRLGFFLQQLEHHHLIEDRHYFPVLAAAEQRLARGFEVLEGDHTAIHGGLERLELAGNGFLQALSQPSAELPRASERLAIEIDGFLGLLRRHLEDEEDLIIPLILDRSEQALGIA